MSGREVWLLVQLGSAACLVLIGATVAVAGGLVSGGLVAGAGAVWAVRGYRQI
jgi:hypothetical protein